MQFRSGLSAGRGIVTSGGATLLTVAWCDFSQRVLAGSEKAPIREPSHHFACGPLVSTTFIK